MSPDVAGASRWRPAAHVAVLGVTFVALFVWTWGKWPDVMVDFGRELYVPWLLSEGKRLHADIAWFNGPLSPHWNAWMFRAFGVGLTTLVWVNAALFASTLMLLHYVLRRISSLGAATSACLVVMALCGFGQLVGIGNYNYITPYSHEATHGVLLGIAALAAAQRWGGCGSIVWVLLCGLCVGLAFLTKPEMFVAALAGGGIAVFAHAWSARFAPARAGVALALGLLTAILAAWALQIHSLGSDAAWQATLGAWPQLWSSDVTSLKFYRQGLGTDEPLANVMKMLTAAGIASLLFVPAVLFARFGRGGNRRPIAALASIVITAAVFGALYTTVRWSDGARSWPLFTFVVLLACAVATWRHRGSARWPGALALAAFSLAMLAKMILNARLAHYGFALAMPATALLVIALWSWIPRRFADFLGDGFAFRAAVATALVSFCTIHLATTRRMHGMKRVELGEGADAFTTDIRGRFVGEVLAWLEGHRPADAPTPTMAVFPEGVSINYLARLENPTPYVNFMPPEIMLFGEERILAAYENHPPDIVLLTHKSTAEYGHPWFGRDYAQTLMNWIAKNYRPVALFGDPPLGLTMQGEPPLKRAPVFGIRVFVRVR